MDLPKRHRNHQIEELSERYFKSQIPVNWVINSFKSDYGTDYNCEVDINGGMSGRNFTIQLKGKERDNSISGVKISKIKRTTINRWLNRLEPTMIIVFIVNESKAYWTWFKGNTVDLTKDSKSFTISIPRENELSKTDWSEIKSYINTIFSRRHLLYKLPEIGESNKQAWTLYFERKFTDALPLFNKLVVENPNGQIWHAISVCQYEMYHYQDALLSANKALQYSNENVIYFNKATILTEQGALEENMSKIKEALKLYENVIDSTENDDALLLYNYGSAFIKKGDYTNAEIQLRKALEVNPNHAEIWNNLGNVYLHLGNHDLELECYDNALQINPMLAEALFSKGSTLFRYFNQIDEGLALMLKASEISDRYNIDFPNLYFWISEVYIAKNEIKNAIKWNSNGLLAFPTDKYLLNQRERIVNNNEH